MNLGGERPDVGSTVVLRMYTPVGDKLVQVEAAELVECTLALLRRDLRAIKAVGVDDDDITDHRVVMRAAAALQRAYEHYYLPPTRSGAPA